MRRDLQTVVAVPRAVNISHAAPSPFVLRAARLAATDAAGLARFNEEMRIRERSRAQLKAKVDAFRSKGVA
jgi:hypothetical protein